MSLLTEATLTNHDRHGLRSDCGQVSRSSACVLLLWWHFVAPFDEFLSDVGTPGPRIGWVAAGRETPVLGHSPAASGPGDMVPRHQPGGGIAPTLISRSSQPSPEACSTTFPSRIVSA